MKWLALFTWILVVLVALPAARAQLPSMVGQVVCALGGLGTMVVFASGGTAAWAWLAFALGCVGTLLAAVGAHTLVEDSPGAMQWISQHRKEVAAGLEGAALPFFAAAAVLSLPVAVG